MSADDNTGLGTDTFDNVSSVQRQPPHRSSAAFLRRADPSAARLLSPARDSVLRKAQRRAAERCVGYRQFLERHLHHYHYSCGGEFWTFARFRGPGMNSSNPVTFYGYGCAAAELHAFCFAERVTLVQGSSGTSTITVTLQNGFSGSVNLSASGLPSGVTASFSQAARRARAR